METFMEYADRIGFFVGGAIRKITTPKELKRQYQQAIISIRYRNNTSTDESIVFDFTEEAKATWLNFLQGHSITEITTQYELDQNIFEKETGGNVE
jgi:ABC-type multidrug transport system ATPase subunit